MPLFPPAEQAPIAGWVDPRELSYDSVYTSLTSMKDLLTRVTASPQMTGAFQDRADGLQAGLDSLMAQVHGNRDGDPRALLGLERQRQFLETQLQQFYEALGGAEYAVTLRGTPMDVKTKYLWMAGGAAALAVGAIGLAFYLSKPKKSNKIGKLLKGTKFKRALPAR